MSKIGMAKTVDTIRGKTIAYVICIDRKNRRYVYKYDIRKVGLVHGKRIPHKRANIGIGMIRSYISTKTLIEKREFIEKKIPLEKKEVGKKWLIVETSTAVLSVGGYPATMSDDEVKVRGLSALSFPEGVTVADVVGSPTDEPYKYSREPVVIREEPMAVDFAYDTSGKRIRSGRFVPAKR